MKSAGSEVTRPPDATKEDRPTSTPQPPTIPDHLLLRRIGGGSYGEVWLARNRLGTLRAVKVVWRQTFERDEHFEREYKGLQKFEPLSRSHEGLVDILHVGRDDAAGCFFYVMELADAAEPRVASDQCSVISKAVGDDGTGSLITDPLITDYSPKTLRTEIKRRARLPPAECVRIGLALSEALAHLHKRGLVHRDIKPSNIIFVNGVPKLADIGLVAETSEAKSFVGTVGFIPPEGPGTPQADIYSLGKVLYELSTGRDRHDFPALSPDLRALPDAAGLVEFNEILLKACEADFRKRYQTAQQMHDELALLQCGHSIKRKRATARRWTIATRAGLLVAGLAALVVAVPFKKIWNRGRVPKPEAVRLFELGNWYHNQFTEEGQTKAIQYLNQAIQIEPNYVDAYRLLFEINLWASDSEDKKKSTRQLAAKLMALDPKLAEAHTALSWAKHLEGDWPGAEQEIQTAIKLNPNYSEARCLYGFYLSLQRRVEEAIPQMQRAKELDPTSRLHATAAGFPFIAARQYDLAIAQFRKALELDPNFALAHLWIGKALEAKGEYLEALGEFEKNTIFSGVDEKKARERFDKVRQGYTTAGARGYWMKVLEYKREAEASREKAKISEQDRWPLDGVYAQMGEKEKALDLLERFLKSNGHAYGYWLKFDPLYDPLHEEPRFKALLKRLGLEK